MENQLEMFVVSFSEINTNAYSSSTTHSFVIQLAISMYHTSNQSLLLLYNTILYLSKKFRRVTEVWFSQRQSHITVNVGTCISSIITLLHLFFAWWSIPHKE